jgi:signal transduction histidine kinase
LESGLKSGEFMSAAAQQPEPRFVSLHRRMLSPMFLMLLLVSVVGAYLIGSNLGESADGAQTKLLAQSAQAMNTRAADLYEELRAEAERIAFTEGVNAAVQVADAAQLQPILDALGRLAELDVVIMLDSQGREIIGLTRVEHINRTDYAVSTQTDLRDEALVRSVLDQLSAGASGLLRTTEGIMLVTEVPLQTGNDLVGIVVTGRQLQKVLDGFKSDGLGELALFGEDGQLLQTTLPPDDAVRNELLVSAEAIDTALTADHQITVQRITLDTTPYQTTLIPFRFGQQTLGLMSILLPDNVPLITQSAHQLTGLTLALIAAGILTSSVLTLNNRVVQPARRIAEVAEALALGQSTVRTLMQSTDEIGGIGRALDQYADYVQEHQDALRVTLRRQRRETEYLMMVLESMPDGVVVQDQDGHVMMMNESAKVLLGGQRSLRDMGLHNLTTLVTDTLGPALAPGIYALGAPHRVELDGKMLKAQAAAVMNVADQRVGTVIVIRDISEEIRRERQHADLLRKLEVQVQKPLAEIVRAQTPLNAVVHSLSRHAVTLQKLIVEMREVTMPDAPDIREMQRPIYLDTLVWSIANEWRQVAVAANLALEVKIERPGLYILGDERRLRWAVGNIIDNAIKYTPPGGKCTLEVNGELNGRALMRVRDNGVGITAEELPHVFTRFYRGTPTTQDGRVIRVPGTGQGLSIAKQAIEAHGGLIQVKSKPGVGTAVYFGLPLTAEMGYTLPHLTADVDLEGETIRLNRAD